MIKIIKLRLRNLDNYVICRKLAQKKYQSKDNWVGKVITWELCKRLNLMLIKKKELGD